ncbi:MauE/DoxX family redox-associated membrane protein [Holophaga foetida]|uniref:MauE/DoxX family redox-associated membrane protein n=1 Tax=Holophaga foetida TaxID=35839 RepID=UPI0002472617|nr:MauE/DoxX family redox-associated membrane protein [Holophaga foetida]
MKPIRELLLHPWLSQRAQFLLGILFAVAAWPKLMDPPSFAKALWTYALFPAWSILPLALVVPWLELLCGLLLVLGIWVRAATSWITLLLLGFILALSINLVRRHPVDCGCFSVAATTRTTEERLGDMRLDILRDLGMLALATLTLLDQRRKAHALPKDRG